MTKKLTQLGNSAALVIEKPILKLLDIDMDTELEVVTDGKNIIISPIKLKDSESKVLESLSKITLRHSETLKRLAE